MKKEFILVVVLAILLAWAISYNIIGRNYQPNDIIMEEEKIEEGVEETPEEEEAEDEE